MKKRLLVSIIAVVMSVCSVACQGNATRANNTASQMKEYFGDDSDAIQEMLEKLYEAYEECDGNKLNECFGPQDITEQKIDVNLYQGTDFPKVYFMKLVNMKNPATIAASTDFYKNYAKDELEQLMKKYEEIDINIKYEIKEAKSSKELETIFYREGLGTKEEKGFEFLKDKLGRDVEDYYGVVIKPEVFYDGKKFGSQADKDFLVDIDQKVNDSMTREESVNRFERVYEDSDKDLNYLIYKIDGRWYVYHRIALINLSMNVFEFENPNKY